MNRHNMVETVGSQYHESNIEGGEWSYVKDAGDMATLTAKLGGETPERFKLDIRFADSDDTGDYAVLIETKQNFRDEDAEQLRAYIEEEYALHRGTKIIAILANTNDDRIRAWKSEVDGEHLLPDETVLDSMEHYKKLFSVERQNDREKVMRNTYALNELLHRKDIDERNRSQFVGTCLLFIKSEVEKYGHGGRITDEMKKKLQERWSEFTPTQIRSAIGEVLEGLLDGSKNKELKVKLLQRDVLNDQKVKALTQEEWIEVLTDILMNIYRYIDADSSEGQDILNLFFITFNKYVGKADKNQAFTPDHITDFMCQVVDVTFKDVVLDECCGSGSFLVQAMVKELADARRGHTEVQFKELADEIKQKHIFGIENEEKAYGLATTNMLIHGDGNSNVEFGSCFDKQKFIVDAKPTVMLMNPPYNAKPRTIPDRYKTDWTASEKNGKSDPTKGMVFVKYLSDIAKEEGWDGVRLAVLLPMAAAIGTKERVGGIKERLLQDNTLEAVFTLPPDIFYPGAAVQAVCMVFTLNRSHYETDGVTPRKQTFFGFYKDDGFIKKKNLGRVEQFNDEGQSNWKQIQEKWLDLYKNKKVEAGYSAMCEVKGKEEWVAEAYMETDYMLLTETDFLNTTNNYLAYLMKEGQVYES
ncbi:N-6 DNA methylase [Adlercreutzia sp. ZJ304]|uniref:HsdM family class I SAM-dependent methyltransferase n=1 Tax=Adlercreutzia sp. ZJ304 TaxID=2709791 RepID=UPI0013EAABFA|nr:N-6 DNA methylase [Adlercreutzia sp. ZJ304]